MFPASTDRERSVLVVLALLIAVVAVFGQTLRFKLVAWDDPEYVTQNAHVRAGLTRESVAWAFTDTDHVNWHPLTWLSHMLDIELFGENTGGHHATNVALHFANSVLVYRIFFGLTGTLGCSAMLALLFAIHPLHVEPVAWVSERKELLCTLFSLLAIASHVARVRRGGRMAGVLVVVAFGCALMAKSMAVTLPFVLLLLDVWPLRRAPRWGLVVEKLPLFGLAGLVGILAVSTQRGGGAVVSLSALPIGARAANAIVSAAVYLRDVCWPRELMHFYPHPYLPATGGQPLSGMAIAGSVALLIAISGAVAWAGRRRWPWVGWCWFLGTLVPVVGLVQVGQQGHADRYMYFPSIGVFLVVVWGFAEGIDRTAERWRSARPVLMLLVAAATIAFGVQAWRQTGYWKDTPTLFRHALEIEPRNVLVRFDVASQLRDAGRLEEAVAEYERILEVRPTYAEANLNLANVLRRQGRLERAIGHYERALAQDPDYALAHANLASALRERGDAARAIEHYERALALRSDRTTLFNLGNLYRAQGLDDRAIPLYERALAMGRDGGRIHSALGKSLLATGRTDLAIEQFRTALQRQPRDADAANNLGVALEAKGDIEAAITAYRGAISRSGGHRRAHSNLALLLLRRGEVEEARRSFERALEIDPANPDARRGLDAIANGRR